ncbi:MAG: hypothetical protein NC339_07220 [Muribaculaceae bacterium]|nr:hypothetical protein [Muribaculaceae bacterium]
MHHIGGERRPALKRGGLTSSPLYFLPPSSITSFPSPTRVMFCRFCILLSVLLSLVGCGHTDRNNGGELFGAEGIDLRPSEIRSDSALSPLEIYLGGALLAPQVSMESLLSLTENGIINRPGLPMVYDCPEWGAAAWAVYCSTGSEKWLLEAYNIIMATLRSERQMGIYDNLDGLLHGVTHHLPEMYPEWFTEADKISSASLYVNSFHYTTLRVAADMARILGLATEQPLLLEAKQLREKINMHFWSSPHSRYGQFRYPEPYPVLSTAADCAANAVCILSDIPLPEMADAFVAKTPSLPSGFPETYPLNTGDTSPKATTQALMAMVAEKVDNTEAFKSALLALKNLDGNRGMLWSATLVSTVFGLYLTPDGINVSPFIPEHTSATATLDSLRYRNTVVNISVTGTGDRIASFTIDSVPAHPFIPASLEGIHDVEIVMASNNIAGHTHTELTDEEALTMPLESNLYNIYTDGVLQAENASLTAYTHPANSVMLAVPTDDEGLTEGVAQPPVFDLSPDGLTTVSATSITPRRPPVNLIKNRDVASHFIELAPRHNTRLTFYATLPHSGRYYVRIFYTNATHTLARRTLGLITTVDSITNNTPLGVLVCPPVPRGSWTDISPSTWVEADLSSGLNRLSLTYITGTILFNRIEFVYLPTQKQ